jgi:suppressor for copper-sensitivity B
LGRELRHPQKQGGIFVLERYYMAVVRIIATNASLLKGILLGGLIAVGLILPSQQARGASSERSENASVSASLISAENAVGPDAEMISAGLHLQLEEGWKTYWRSPGEVGIPPSIDWAGSEKWRMSAFFEPH